MVWHVLSAPLRFKIVANLTVLKDKPPLSFYFAHSFKNFCNNWGFLQTHAIIRQTQVKVLLLQLGPVFAALKKATQ